MNVVRGVHAVREALRASPARVRKLVVAEGALDGRKRELVALAREHRIPVYREPRARVGHQGVAAELAPLAWLPLEDLVAEAAAPALFLALDQVEDPRNFGAVVRTAEGAGVSGIIIPERKSAPPSDAAVAASAGALHHARVARVRNLSDALTFLKGQGIWSVGLSPEADTPWHRFDYTEPVVVVLGSEGKGLRRRVAATCDALVSLPQRGQVESLNLSVAAGIVLYEAVRQRAGKPVAGIR